METFLKSVRAIISSIILCLQFMIFYERFISEFASYDASFFWI